MAAWEGRSARRHYRWLTVVGRTLPKLRGLRRLTLILGRRFDRDNAVVIRHERGFPFRVGLADPYWTRLLFAAYRYEPDVEWCLDRALTEAAGFVDCGANTGFWTNFASSRVARVVAIEPASTTFERLRRNVELVSGRIELLQVAVDRQSGREAELVCSEVRHGAAHLLAASSGAGLASAPGTTREVVRTIALDDLDLEGAIPCVIKLDVEGLEVAALEGARRLIESRPLIVFEDHGSDPECTVSRYLFGQGLSVYSYSDRLRRLRTPAEVAASKRNRRRGYNFFACHPGSRFAQRLEQDRPGRC